MSGEWEGVDVEALRLELRDEILALLDRLAAAEGALARVREVAVRAVARIRHDHAYPMEVGPHHCEGCEVEADLRAALDGAPAAGEGES